MYGSQEDDRAGASRIVCKHCGRFIHTVNLIGLSLLCPYCHKPQNGQPHAY